MKYQYMRSIIFTLVNSVLLAMLIMSVVQAEPDLAVAKVVEQTVPQLEVFDAVVEAIHQSTVSSRIAAEVIELNFDVNDVVPKDALIMKFRDEEFQARIAQIQAGLLADKAQSREAVARQKEAESEFKRVENLFKRKLLAQAALDKANADLSASNAKAQTVQAQIKVRQAQLKEANVQLSYTQIIAPYSGIVTERLIELGEMASPGQHLMSGVSLESLRVTLNVPQYLFAAIRMAQDPIFILPDGRKINGGEITIIPSANAANHSFKLRVELPEGIEYVYPGMFGKIQFIVGDEQLRVIPQSAVVQRSEVAGVYVLTDKQQLIFRQIRLGRVLADDQQEVLAGLSVGEHVALDPLQAVRLLKLNSSQSQP